jgi:phage regulator Rha-like protein
MKLLKSKIEDRIFSFRATAVMVDSDLAEMYGVETKRLNEQVKRNIHRFPDTYRFQLSDNEKNELVANCDRFQNLKHSSSNSFVFTEQGVAMLSAVLRSEIAVKVSIQIIDAFVEMRKQLGANNLIDLRLSNIERKQLEADQKFEQVFKALEKSDIEPQQGVFFEGQIFDAYTFVADVIRSAKNSVILIDNYIDDTILTLLAKRNKNVTAIIYTQKNDKQLQLDLKKHNQQYPEIKIHSLANVHDRFLLIDEKELYHIGASLKDLGKKWFAFSKMNDFTAEILKRIQL